MSSSTPIADMRILSDHELIAEAVVGVSAAFGELVRRHAPALRTHLRRMGAQGADADDMAQEAFISAYESLADYRADGPFINWLKMIAARRYLRKIRTTQKYLLVDDVEPYEPAQDVYAVRGREGAAYDLDGALARLKPAERMCVTLNISGGLSHPEVAAETGLPLGTVKSHIKRGLAQLKAALGAAEPAPAAIYR